MDEKKMAAVLSRIIAEALTNFGHLRTDDVVPVKICKESVEVRSDGRASSSDGVRLASRQDRETVGTMDVMEALMNYLVYHQKMREIKLTDYKSMSEFIRVFLLVCRGFCAKGYEVNFRDMICFTPYLRKAKEYEDEADRKLCAEAHLTGDWKILDSKAETYIVDSKEVVRQREARERARQKAAANPPKGSAGRITQVKCTNCGSWITIANTVTK